MKATKQTTPQASGNFLIRIIRHEWFVVVTPLLLLVVIVLILMMTKEKPASPQQPGTEQPGVEQPGVEQPAVENPVRGQLAIANILLPAPGVMLVEVVNGSDEVVSVPQVLVDDAYWDFTVVPSNTITVTGIATFTLPYPWVTDERHVVRLITSRGETVEGEVTGTTLPAATASE